MKGGYVGGATARRGRGVASEVAGATGCRRAAGATWGSRRRWCMRCRTHSPRSGRAAIRWQAADRTGVSLPGRRTTARAQAVVERGPPRPGCPRPAPATWVTALLPGGWACRSAALKRAADTTIDDRTRGRAGGRHVGRAGHQATHAGRPTGSGQPVVLSDETLLAGDRAPAVVEQVAHPRRRGPQPGARRGCRARSRTRCAIYPSHRAQGPWWRWSRPGAGSRRAGARSSGCAISAVAYCDADPATVTTPNRISRRPRPPTNDRIDERCSYVEKLPAGAGTGTDETGRHTAEFTAHTGMYYPLHRATTARAVGDRR